MNASLRPADPTSLLRRLLGALTVVTAMACSPGGSVDLPEEGAEILWDEYGIPHIYAADHASLFRAYGWAQMQSHGPRLLRLVATARGRASEYFGERHLRSDRWVHTVAIPRRAERWLAAQDSTMRRYVDAFVAGMNAWAEDHPGEMGMAVRRVLPVRPEDVLAVIQHQVHFTFMIQPGVVPSLERSWTPGSVVASASGTGGAPGHGRAGRLPQRARLASNAWAVSAARSASGNAMLLANPHLPWGGRFTWYEAHLVAPGVDASGVSLLGQPLLGIGFNDALGWTHTVNTHDGVDLYELELAGGGYRWDGGVRAFDVHVDTLLVREKNGEMREETVTVRRSVHGPVLVRRGGHAVAMRVAGLGEPELFRQYWDMIRADDLSEFEDALRQLQMPMFTVMYADRDGHILHLFGGRTPDRPAGDWNWRRIVPGDTSATLWTDVHDYDELPRVLDPESGWLQNANDPPWTTTFPRALNPDSFPRYMAPRGMALRPQRSARMLASDSSVTYGELIDYKHSTRMLAADRILDELLAAAREHGGETARRAADVLEDWDREADADSRGAVLFRAFLYRHLEREGDQYATAWSPERPLSTPDGLAAPELAAVDLEAAAREVEQSFGRLDVPWGDTRRFRLDSLDLPGNGSDGGLGVFRVVNYDRADSLYRAAGGDSYVAALEFAPDGVRARALIGYGNASRPGAPHRTDQLPLVAEKELRPVWRTRPEVEAHTSERTVIP